MKDQFKYKDLFQEVQQELNNLEQAHHLLVVHQEHKHNPKDSSAHLHQSMQETKDNQAKAYLPHSEQEVKDNQAKVPLLHSEQEIKDNLVHLLDSMLDPLHLLKDVKKL